MGQPRPAPLIATLLVVALLGLGCGAESGGDTETPAQTSTAPPSPSSAPATPSAVSLTATIQGTIAAIESADSEAIAPLLELKSVPCSADNWPYPVCAPSEPEGTEHRLFPFVSCGPEFLRADELLVTLDQVSSGRSPALEAAVATGPSNEPFPLGPYVAVFRTSPPAGVTQATGIAVVLREDGRIVSVRTGCRATPAQLLASLPAHAPIPGVARTP